jgi:hypothetical protein
VEGGREREERGGRGSVYIGKRVEGESREREREERGKRGRGREGRERKERERERESSGKHVFWLLIGLPLRI